MGLAWDGDGSRIVVELLAITEAEVSEETVLDDSADGPDALRVFLSLDEAMSSRRRPAGSCRPAARRARCATTHSTPRATSARG